MKPGTYAVYTISISPPTQQLLNVLKEFIPSSIARQTDGAWFVPRLCTYWKGDSEERQWQEDLRRKLKDASERASLVIEAVEWTPAEGYPQGDVSL